MQSRNWPIGVANNPLVLNPLVNGAGGNGLFPPPGFGYIITETSDYIVTEAGDRMITE